MCPDRGQIPGLSTRTEKVEEETGVVKGTSARIVTISVACFQCLTGTIPFIMVAGEKM